MSEDKKTFNLETDWIALMVISVPLVVAILMLAEILEPYFVSLTVGSTICAVYLFKIYASRAQNVLEKKIKTYNASDFKTQKEFKEYAKLVEARIAAKEIPIMFISLPYIGVASYGAYRSHDGFFALLGVATVLLFSTVYLIIFSANEGELNILWRKRKKAIEDQVNSSIRKMNKKNKEDKKNSEKLEQLETKIPAEAKSKIEKLKKQEAKELKKMQKLIPEIENEIKALKEISDRHSEVQAFLSTRADTEASLKLIDEVKKKYSV
jgi:hypothetical protein